MSLCHQYVYVHTYIHMCATSDSIFIQKTVIKGNIFVQLLQGKQIKIFGVFNTNI